MIILGVNGGIERSHDASACLVINNAIIAMAEEERFIRKKNAIDVFPIMAIAFCLQKAGITPDDIDLIAWGWNLPDLYAAHGREFPFNERSINDILFPKRFYSRKGKIIPVEYVDHHMAHAASAYCCRETDDMTAVVVVDGSGERDSISIFKGEGGELKKILSFPVHVSPGFFYGAGSKYLGFSTLHGGKLMGLASYGNSRTEEFYWSSDDELAVPFSEDILSDGELDWADEIIEKWLSLFEARWGKASFRPSHFSDLSCRFNLSPDITKKEREVASSLQKELERIYLWCINKALSATGSKHLALAGGVALNCSANGLVIDSKVAEKVYLQPASGDAGTSLGAALSITGKISPGIFTHPYLGPEFNEESVRSLLKSINVTFRESGNIHQDTIRMISSGKVVAWFNGRMEVGPRALGNRSILADPRNRKMLDKINIIKGREWWRPLAPCVLEDSSSKFFTGDEPTPFMLMRKFVRQETASLIPATVHVDNSARPQTVSEESNSDLFKLLLEADSKMGVPVLINTSFNVGYEPIVCSPLEAIRTFFSSGIDALVMNPFVIEK